MHPVPLKVITQWTRFCRAYSARMSSRRAALTSNTSLLTVKVSAHLIALVPLQHVHNVLGARTQMTATPMTVNAGEKKRIWIQHIITLWDFPNLSQGCSRMIKAGVHFRQSWLFHCPFQSVVHEQDLHLFLIEQLNPLTICPFQKGWGDF